MRVSDIAGVKTQAVLTRKQEMVGSASQNQAVNEQHLLGRNLSGCAGHVTVTYVPSKH